MFWLYFARDFYRAGSDATEAPPTHEHPRAIVATIAVRNPQPVVKVEPPKRSVAKRSADYAVRSEPTDISPINAYLQRLSVDGEHAFGIWDEDAGFSMFSANFERVTGLSSGDCAGHDWIHLIHHDQQYCVNEALLSAMEGHDGSCLIQVRRDDESPIRWLLLDIKAPSARQPQIMVLMRNLTEQKALEETLKVTESALAVAEKSRANFLSSMSHELRTPLNAIMGFSELMKRETFGELGNPTYSEYAAHIHESGANLLGKINDLLDIASMDVGGLEIEESEFHLHAMLLEAIEIHTHHAFGRQQKLHLDCPHKLEIKGDRAKLMSGISHLITNALRHSKDGADVTVSVRVQGDEGIIISVRDTGEGISTAQLEIIRKALSADVAYFNIECGGIGLGLSLTKELAQRHGGRLMIDSIRHRGTVVSLILPTSRALNGLPERRKRMMD